jgi:hypothetical protein
LRERREGREKREKREKRERREGLADRGARRHKERARWIGAHRMSMRLARLLTVELLSSEMNALRFCRRSLMVQSEKRWYSPSGVAMPTLNGVRSECTLRAQGPGQGQGQGQGQMILRVRVRFRFRVRVRVRVCVRISV